MPLPFLASSALDFNGTFFLYGSYVTLSSNVGNTPIYNTSTPISSSIFSPAFVSSTLVNVTLNSSTVYSLPDGRIRITLATSELEKLIDQLFAYLLPFVPLFLQFGQPLISIALQAYCLFQV